MTPTVTNPTPHTYGQDASWAQISVAQYQRMIEEGIITPDDQIELLENHLVRRMPGNPPHDNAVSRANRRFHRLLPDGWLPRVQSSLQLPDSQPQPDLLIARGDDDTYALRHPGPDDTALVVEVAHSSLLRDRRDKARLYARAGVVRYWIVNLVDECVEVHEGPSGLTADPQYAAVTPYARGAAVQLILDGVTVATIAVDELLG